MEGERGRDAKETCRGRARNTSTRENRRAPCGCAPAAGCRPRSGVSRGVARPPPTSAPTKPPLLLLLLLLLTTTRTAHSDKCTDAINACTLALTGVDVNAALPHIMSHTTCPWIRGIFWANTDGCARQAPCCCCDKVNFVDTTNLLIISSQIGPYLGSECKDNPLQCDPEIDCNACKGGSPCADNPSGLTHIDVAKSSCQNTESGSACETFVCETGYDKNGIVMCLNGEWDLTNAKCLSPCQNDPDFAHIDLENSHCEGTLHGETCAYVCLDGYFASSDSVACKDGAWTPGPKCNKIDWCAEKKTPHMRLKKRRIVKPPRTGWDRGKELNKRDGTWATHLTDPERDELKLWHHFSGGFRCLGPSISYEIPPAEYAAYKAFMMELPEGHHDPWRAEKAPPSPVDLCEQACMDISSWAPSINSMQARGFSLNWVQMTEEHAKKWLEADAQPYMLWRGLIDAKGGLIDAKGWGHLKPDCKCESADSKICVASRRHDAPHATRYDFQFEKDNDTFADIVFKTEYSWDELRDPDGPFETPGSIGTALSTFTHMTKNGGQDCTKATPCGLCQGDCDTDDDCAGELRCWQRGNKARVHAEINRIVGIGNGPAEVPGCSGLGETFQEGEAWWVTHGTSKPNPHEHGAFDYHKDYCYDPNVLSAKCRARIPEESQISGELRGGQTCTLQKAVVVPACTELFLAGVEGDDSGSAIISGAGKTNHFDVNGKLTLKNLVLEHGLAFDYRGGSLHVSGFDAVVHLIGSTIRKCSVTEDSNRISHGYGLDGVTNYLIADGESRASGGEFFHLLPIIYINILYSFPPCFLPSLLC